jgi:glycerol kinase
MTETTALGAAMVAGMAEGVNVWNTDCISKVTCDLFTPAITEDGKSYLASTHYFVQSNIVFSCNLQRETYVITDGKWQ